MSRRRTGRPLLVDVHSHVYTPTYLDLLKRAQLGSEAPSVVEDGQTGRVEVRVRGEASGAMERVTWGDRTDKVRFMDQHGIDVSIVSLGNPWLDNLGPDEAVKAAQDINDELEQYCTTFDAAQQTSASEYGFEPRTNKRLFAFGVLPLVDGVSISDIVAAIERVHSSTVLKGVIIGTRGLGRGLDDQDLEPVWQALEDAGLAVFVHPHSGVDGPSGTGQHGKVLPLAIGQPFEMTQAISRLILSGVLDRHAALKLLLADSAGALPALSSRLSMCIAHDDDVRDRLQNDFRYYLGQMWYDAVSFGPHELALVERTIARAGNFEGKDEELEFVDRVTRRADLLAPSGVFSGVERIMFGTDHPFFPPPEGPGATWKSVEENMDAIESVEGWSEEERAKVLGGTAVDLFGLEL